jgi:hypothetical protein
LTTKGDVLPTASDISPAAPPLQKLLGNQGELIMTFIAPTLLASITGGQAAQPAPTQDKELRQICPLVAPLIEHDDPNKPSLGAAACAVEFAVRNPAAGVFFHIL